MRSGMGILFIFFTLFSFAQANRNDVVIDEIMADPSPQVGLPNAEFIELKNASRKPINLRNWKISDATGTAVISANFTLQPDSFVVLCGTGSATGLSMFGAALGVSAFPSLDNDGEWLLLRAADGSLIHSVQYSKSWYNNDVKKEGGWTLEMIDPANACSGSSNWEASTDQKGGTPGRKNSVDAINADHSPPLLLRSYAPDSLSIVLLFNEPLDSLGAVASGNYSIDGGVGPPVKVVVLSPLFSRVILYLAKPLLRDKRYLVSVQQIRDCSGNQSSGTDTVSTGLAGGAQPFDLVINEILFNPRPGGVDFVEIYNRGARITDLKDLLIANRSSANTLANLASLSVESRLLFPGGYCVVTEDAAAVQRQYLAMAPKAFIEVSAMPSYPDDKGTAVLVTTAGMVIDELRYDEKWHFPLLDNREGVSLERINYNKPTQDASNWYSASTPSGYGTPTYRNSQFMADPSMDNAVSILPAVFSPDNDGTDDFATVRYDMPEPGFVCNITLYNSYGVPVRMLVRNALCGKTGSFRWDGIDEKGRQCALGVYIALIEMYNLKGTSRRWKKTITLVRRLN